MSFTASAGVQRIIWNILWNKSTVYVPLRPKNDISNKKQHDLGTNDAMDLALK